MPRFSECCSVTSDFVVARRGSRSRLSVIPLTRGRGRLSLLTRTMLTLEYSVATTRRLVSLTVWLSFVATRLANLFLVGARFVSLTGWLSLVVTRRLSVLSRGARLVSLTVWLSLVAADGLNLARCNEKIVRIASRRSARIADGRVLVRWIVDLFADLLVWQLIAALWRWVARRQ
jgi:hypothetical protein